MIDEVTKLLKPNQRLLFITGAGVSADSGLPTYRGTGGIYQVDDTEEGIPIETALSGPVFQRTPEVTWKYLAQIADAAKGAKHNAAHQVIAEFESKFEAVTVLTQNVDGFHRDAGSTNLIEIHGNLRSISCTSCDFARELSQSEEIPISPTCDKCNSVMRPDVVLFDEMLPIDAQAQLNQAWESGFDVVFSIGTTSVFPYIAQPFMWAANQGRLAIEINPDSTRVTKFATHKIKETAATALVQIRDGLEF